MQYVPLPLPNKPRLSNAAEHFLAMHITRNVMAMF